MGPYNRDKGRSDEVPDHVPKNSNLAESVTL
jgi:hypothetical protein